jgi:nicotinate-nucleotide--dimethylbenzimidazole phosphoribosyltransferase
MTEAVSSALLDAAIEGIDYPDADAAHASVLRRAGRGEPAGALGVLEELSAWAAGVQGSDPPRPFDRARLMTFGAVPGRALRALADAAGVDLVAADDTGQDAPADTDRAIEAGIRVAVEAGIAAADREIEAGADLLIAADLAEGVSVPAAALISVLTDTEPIKVVGRPPGSDDAGWIANCAAIRDTRRRAWPHRTELLELLAVTASPELAALTGLLLQAANRRTPVLLDGVAVSAAAAAAQLACPRVVRWFQAAQLSPDPAHAIALQRLGLTPILRLDIWQGRGIGALLAMPVLRTAVLSLNYADDAAEAGGASD